MRVLITGGSGFAGGCLARACAQAGEEVLAISRSGVAPAGVQGAALDLQDEAATRRTVAETAPDAVYHLAALSSVGRSWEEPAEAVRANLGGSLSLLEALRLEAPGARTVWVSSCEVYGRPQLVPIPEEAPLQPESPYAVSKAAGEQLAGVYGLAYGLDLVRVRPFSHTGPGQRSMFIVSALAQAAAEARAAGKRRLQIPTGNPDTRRDFTHVLDVVDAYRRVATAGSGVFNVCSGRSTSTAELVRMLSELIAPVEVEHVVDPARVRAHEIPELRGDNQRLRRETGWAPQLGLRETLAEMLVWWERRLSGRSR